MFDYFMINYLKCDLMIEDEIKVTILAVQL